MSIVYGALAMDFTCGSPWVRHGWSHSLLTVQNAWSEMEGAEVPRALLHQPHPGAGLHPPERTPPCFSLIPQGGCSRPAGYLLGMGQDVGGACSLQQWRQNRVKCVDSQSKVARQSVTRHRGTKPQSQRKTKLAATPKSQDGAVQ